MRVHMFMRSSVFRRSDEQVSKYVNVFMYSASVSVPCELMSGVNVSMCGRLSETVTIFYFYIV